MVLSRAMSAPELRPQIIERLQAQDAKAVPGVGVYFQPVPDIRIAPAPSRAQYQYTLVGVDAGGGR